MTGTALSEDSEFREIYDLDVVVVPTNKPMIRKDHNDRIYRTCAGRDRAVIEQIKECHEKGQPVLVGTVSIEKSEAFSKKLKGAGIPHTVLNAKYHAREAEIVAQAGKFGAVTISTNMAGRGTDIMLGGNAEFLAKKQMREDGYEEEMIALATGSSQSVSEEVFEARRVFNELYNKYKAEIEPEAERVRAAGGLFIIGTERHESRRIDNQLRGRAGRQGDPGESRFFISLQDDLMRLFGGERVGAIVGKLGLGEDTALELGLLSRQVEHAQMRLEGRNFARRKHVLSYDDVMNQQRNIIYSQRAEVLDGNDLKPKIENMIKSSIRDNVEAYLSSGRDGWELEALKSKYIGLLCSQKDFEDDGLKAEDVLNTLTERAMQLWNSKEELFGVDGAREVERVILLRNVDEKWMDHLEAMDDLRDSVGLQSYAQRNPISEYRLNGADLFDDMIINIRDDTVRGILSAVPREKPMQRVQVVKPTEEGFMNFGQAKERKPVKQTQQPVRAEQKVGRNELCPCGSGKKYKKCCGANQGGEA